MTAKPLPKGFRLAKSVDQELVLSDEYEHWTVADLIEMLGEYPQDARVWIAGNKKADRLHPVELIFEVEGEVMF